MSLKKLVKEMVEPIVEDMGGIVASDGTIKGGSKLSKIKKMKKKGHTSVPYGSGYKKVNEQKEVKKIVVIYPGRFQPFGPHHKKVFEALGIFALWDAKSIPDRTRRIIELKREIGERVGHAPFGYTYHNKQLIPLEKELAIAAIIREKREDEGLSYHKISKLLNSQRLRAKRGGRWYAETIKVICENPLYERDSKAAKEALSR